jgi:hypothetical protein
MAKPVTLSLLRQEVQRLLEAEDSAAAGQIS